MKKPNTIIIIVILLLIVGVGAYEANKNDSKPIKASSTTEAKPKTTAKSNSGFAPVSTTDVAYEATIKIASADGSTVNGTLASDGKGNSQYTALQDGQNTQLTYTADAYYMCVGGQCFKYAANQSGNANFNPSNYTYTAAQLADYKSTANYKGKKSCPAGSCDVWSVSKAGTTSTLFLDSTKHISQVVSTANGTTSTVTFNYKPVTITVPADAQSISSTTY